MTTPTHMIIAAGLGKGLRKRLAISRGAFVVGAGASDLALILLNRRTSRNMLGERRQATLRAK